MYTLTTYVLTIGSCVYTRHRWTDTWGVGVHVPGDREEKDERLDVFFEEK